MTEPDELVREGSRRSRRYRWLRGVLVAGLALVLVVVAGGLWAQHHLTSQLTRVDGVFDLTGKRPDNGPALEVVLISGDLKTGTLLHLAEDRRSAALVALPKGTPLLDGEDDLSEAVEGGFLGFLGAFELLTGVRVDHVASLDEGFYRELADLHGGITLDLADGGRHRLDGDETWAYLADAQGVEQIDRQQHVLRALLEDSLHTSMRKKPWQVWRFLDVVSRNLEIDSEWSTSELRGLVWSLRDMRTSQIAYVSARPGDDALWAAVAEDRVPAWLADHPDRALPETPL